jgi:predicted transcriptional regulator
VDGTIQNVDDSFWGRRPLLVVRLLAQRGAAHAQGEPITHRPPPQAEGRPPVGKRVATGMHHDDIFCYHDGMQRTQVQLTDEQSRRLKRVAAERGISISEVIRQAVDSHLVREDLAAYRERAIASIGGFHSGEEDISEEHDRYLPDAFAR